tara:strand:+ start:678 stop:911 length:234 start_codon:yes stop_codon:yes gene_type:complete
MRKEPKEKAEQILKRIDYEVQGDINELNKHDIAFYFIDEILDEVFDEFGDLEGTCYGIDNYWIEVRNEILKSKNKVA